MGQIAPESRKFLIVLFSDLREDLTNQTRAAGPARPDPGAAARNRAIYDALLSGLTGDGELPDDDMVREYVVGLAQAVDEENRYEQAVLEHQAFAELIQALGALGGEN